MLALALALVLASFLVTALILLAAGLVGGIGSALKAPPSRVPWTAAEGLGWWLIIGVLAGATAVAYAGHLLGIGG